MTTLLTAEILLDAFPLAEQFVIFNRSVPGSHSHCGLKQEADRPKRLVVRPGGGLGLLHDGFNSFVVKHSRIKAHSTPHVGQLVP